MLSKEEFAKEVMAISKNTGDFPEIMDSLKKLQDSYKIGRAHV